MDLLPRDLSIRTDGKIVVVPVEFGAGTGRVEILAIPSLKRVAQIPVPHTRWSSFSRDGRMFMVGDHEGAQIFDGADRLAAVYDTGQAYLWDIRPSSWRRRACALAGRPLTHQEWKDVLPGREYRPACTT